MSTVQFRHPLELSDDEFRTLLDAAIRGNMDNITVEALKSDPCLDRTYAALISMKKSVEGQLAAKRADYVIERSRTPKHRIAEVERKYQAWRAGALRFKTGVEEFLSSVRPPSSPDSDLRSERNRLLIENEAFRQAIHDHWAHHCTPQCDVRCTADEALWKLIQ